MADGAPFSMAQLGLPLAPAEPGPHRGLVIMRAKFHKFYSGDARRPWTPYIEQALTYQRLEIADETAETLAGLGYSVRIEDAWLTAHGSVTVSGC